jgi:hypothetical protein
MRGLDQLARQLDAAAGGMDHLAASAGPVVAATDNVAKTIETTQARLLRVQRQTDPLLRDLEMVQRRQAVVHQATAQGLYNDDPERRVRDLNNIMAASRTATKLAEDEAKATAQAQQIRNYQRGPADAHVASYEAIQKEIEAQKQLQNIMRQANPPTAHVEDFRAFQAQVAEAQKLRDVMRQANPPVAHVEEFRAIQAQVAEAQKLRDVMRQANPPDLHVQQYRAQQAAVAAAAAEHEEYAKQAHAVRAAVDPVAVAEEKHNAALKTFETLARTVNPATKEMYLSHTQLTKAVAESTREFENAKRNGGQDKFANGMKLASYQATNLGYQINDVLSGIAVGQSPFTIMAQQGGQFYQILADIGGGQGLGALKRGLMTAGATALSVFTPAKVAIGGVAAAIGGSLLAWNSYNNAQKEVAVSLGGLGRTSGLTQQAVNEMAKSTAEASHVSVSSAREMTSAFASLGISGEVIPKLNALVKDFAATTGQTAADATQELGKAFADPARGAEELNKKLGILNAGQLDYIQNLQASGDKAKAATVLATALPDALVKASDVTGTLSEGS